MSYRPANAVDRLILPLDVPTVDEARQLVKQTQGLVGTYKIGMQLQFAGGLQFAEELAKEGHSIFLDVKLLDIDNTITSAVKNVAKMGMKFMTLHAYPKNMRAAVRALEEVGDKDLCLLASPYSPPWTSKTSKTQAMLAQPQPWLNSVPLMP